MNHRVVKNVPLSNVPEVPDHVRTLVAKVHGLRGMLVREVLDHISFQDLDDLVDVSVLLRLPSLLGDDLVMVGANAHHHLGLSSMVIQSYDSSVNSIYLRTGVQAMEALGWEETPASPLAPQMREVVDDQGRVYKAVGTFHGLTAFSIRENLNRLSRSEQLVVLHRSPRSVLKGCSYHKRRLRLIHFALKPMVEVPVTEVVIR